MSIIDFKMPKIKFNKMKMDVMNELEEIDYEKLQKKNTKQKSRQSSSAAEPAASSVNTRLAVSSLCWD